MLTTISTKIDEASTVLSDTVASNQSLFANEDVSITCPPVTIRNMTHAMAHRRIELVAHSNVIASPNTDRTSDNIVAQSNVATQTSETIPFGYQNLASSTPHDVACTISLAAAEASCSLFLEGLESVKQNTVGFWIASLQRLLAIETLGMSEQCVCVCMCVRVC